MAQQGEKKGFIARMLEGKERDEEYARSTLPTSRWALFWDIFKGRFSKLVIVNLLMLIFFIPLILVYFFRSTMLGLQASWMPFASWMGVGYPAMPNLTGLPQELIFSTNVFYGALMIVAGLMSAPVAFKIYVRI